MSGPWGQELELKKLFAIAVLKKPLRQPKDSYDIATSIFGGDTISAMRAGANWPTDPDVMRFREELLAEHGADYFLPSKEDMVRSVLEIAEEKYDNGHLRHDAREREKLLRLASELMGYIEKPKAGGKSDSKAALPPIMFAPYPADETAKETAE